ncbi:MAG TPA: NAD-dependent epimerase/dehydratase family protein [Xanthobacteraceae bacterium]|jgi:UDP-glucuronate 4-epimerase
MRFLVTGSAGFIGFQLVNRLLARQHAVVGLDAITPYYDPSLKRARHAELGRHPNFVAHELMLEDAGALAKLVREADADIVVHLAAQPGVRYAEENPGAYVESNIVGSFNLLEALRAHPCRHLLLASTSSVYGANPRQPFKEEDSTDHPLSLYAATKKAAEVMAYNYSDRLDLPTTVMRLFTVYGPWGRPDMALFKFTKGILEGTPIEVYGAGKMTRDFSYVDDVVEAICRLAERVPGRNTSGGQSKSSSAPFRIVNIGSSRPVGLNQFIATIEAAVGRKALRRELPVQPGEMPATWASTALLEELTGFKPATPLDEGVGNFVAWYRKYYRV